MRCLWLPGLLLFVAGAAYPQLTLSPGSPAGPFSLPVGYTATVYAGATLTTNGVGPTTWSVKGQLPPGLTLNSGQTSATITGTPTRAGNYGFTVSAFDPQFDQTVSQPYNITVVALLGITTPLTLPGGTFGTNYSISLTATGGTPPYFWSIPGSFSAVLLQPGLPPGLTLSSGGLLSGIPTQTGPFTFSIQVNDNSDVYPQSDIRTFTITINPAPTIQGGALPNGTLGVPYQTSLGVQGGSPPFIWLVTQKFLPQGLVLFASGVISGTPTQTGPFSFTVSATDIWGASVSATYTLQISSKLTITTLPPLANGAVGTPYNLTFTADGSPPFAWKVISGGLPAGLTLSATGVLSGTPTAAGTSQFTIQVTDTTTRAVSDAFSLTIAPQLVITTAFLPDGSVGTPYPAGQKIAATGGTPPYTFSTTTGSFPPGLTLNSSTGAITGTPTLGGRNSFTAQVKDSAGITATRTLVINVTAIVFITPSPLKPDASAGTPYSQAISVTGGAAPYTFTLDSGALPGGLTLGATGTLAGTPTVLGTFNFVVRATDANQLTAAQAYQLTVVPPALAPPTVTGVTDSEPPAQQPAAAVQLAQPYPLALTCTITLTFASSAGEVDDPAIQFSGGGRTAQVTIPAGTTASPSVSFSTGTVAGTITLTLACQAGGQDVTPTPAPTRVIQIPAAAPVITAVTAHNTSSGLEVDVTGFSNTRDMASANFQFQAAAGTNLQTAQSTITADQLFATWFSDPTSQQYGSRFTFAQQFTISGNMTGISGVTVTLTNKQGTSNAVTASVAAQ